MIRKAMIVQFVGFGLLASAFFTMNTAQGADLGGDCCDDLEERVVVTGRAIPNVHHANRRFVSAAVRRWARNPELWAFSNAVHSLTEGSEFNAGMDRIAPKSQHAHVNTTLQSSTSFGNALLSCGVYAGGVAQEGQCSWARTSGNQLKSDTTGEAPGLDKTGFGLSAGAQWRLMDEWRLGIAVGYENTLSKQFDDLQALDRITGDVLSLGMVLKNRWGPVSGALSVSGSHGWYDSQRYVGLVGVGDIARSDQKVGSISVAGPIVLFVWIKRLLPETDDRPHGNMAASWLL